MQLEPLLRFQMKGIGYTHPEWGHGAWKGELAVAGESWKSDELDPLAPENLHIQQVVRARMGERDGNRRPRAALPRAARAVGVHASSWTGRRRSVTDSGAPTESRRIPTTMASLHTLEDELLRIGSAYSGKWTYALTELSSGESIGHDRDDVMPTASLIKVPVLTALYRAVDEGRVSLTDRIRYGDEHRCLGSGVLSRMSPGVEMTVRDAAVLMIIISDNGATNMVIDLVGLEHVNETMRGFGLGQT